MGFLNKTSDEEKQKKRDEKLERKRAELQEEARKQRESARFAAALPKWEYKILTGESLAGWGGGKPSPQWLEKKMNELAAQGWRVISISFTGQIKQWLTADMNHIYIVLERPAGLDHLGHAVVQMPETTSKAQLPATATQSTPSS